jgi:hypothetical protein
LKRARGLARITTIRLERAMNFEDAGRAIDREFEKLRKFFNDEVRPETKKEAAEFLRKSANRLTKMAERLEKEEAKP